MDNLIYIIIGAGLGVLTVMLWKRREDKSGGEGLMLIQNQMSELTKVLDSKLSESHKSLSEGMAYQLKHSSEIVRDVTEKLTRLDETNKQVISFTDQLKN